MKAYIDRHRDDYGVEPICRVLQMAPSCYWRHAARQRNPQLRSQRAQRDEGLKADIQRVWHANCKRSIHHVLARSVGADVGGAAYGEPSSMFQGSSAS